MGAGLALAFSSGLDIAALSALYHERAELELVNAVCVCVNGCERHVLDGHGSRDSALGALVPMAAATFEVTTLLSGQPEALRICKRELDSQQNADSTRSHVLPSLPSLRVYGFAHVFWRLVLLLLLCLLYRGRCLFGGVCATSGCFFALGSALSGDGGLFSLLAGHRFLGDERGGVREFAEDGGDRGKSRD